MNQKFSKNLTSKEKKLNGPDLLLDVLLVRLYSQLHACDNALALLGDWTLCWWLLIQLEFGNFIVQFFMDTPTGPPQWRHQITEMFMLKGLVHPNQINNKIVVYSNVNKNKMSFL